jgi:hypothetical protein
MIKSFLRLALTFCLGLSTLGLHSQDLDCPTVPSEEQLAWLRNFQNGQFDLDAMRSGSDYYIPIKAHIVGRDDGSGYYKLQLLLESICELNQDFAETGFTFYLDLPLEYHNQDNWWDQTFWDGYSMISSQNVYGNVNIYWVGSIENGTIAGYFSPGADGIVMNIGSSAPTSNTLPHEVGHFFSLPHTFLGWEGGNVPPSSQQERVDGTNCNSAGDGFCDTPPDYAHYRWSCPSAGPFQDPDSTEFFVVDSFFMSYGGNSCRDRFSGEQQDAMEAYLIDQHPDLIGSATPNFPAGYDSIELVFPEAEANGLAPIGTQFTWTEVEDAVGYHISIGYTHLFTAIAEEAIVTNNTFTAVRLIPDRSYHWRVKPLFEANTCEPYSESREFRTGEQPASGIPELGEAYPFRLWPNPSKSGTSVQLELYMATNENVRIQVLNASGSVVLEKQEFFAWGAQRLDLEIPGEAGLYLVKIEGEQGQAIRRLVIN